MFTFFLSICKKVYSVLFIGCRQQGIFLLAKLFVEFQRLKTPVNISQKIFFRDVIQLSQGFLPQFEIEQLLLFRKAYELKRIENSS